MDAAKIGLRLAMLRNAKGLSASAMSEAIGKSSNYINKIESGKSLPSVEMLIEICKFLEISPADFFDEELENPMMVGEMIENYKKLDSDMQRNLSELMKGMAEKQRW